MCISSMVVADAKVMNDLLQACDVGELATTEFFTSRLIHQSTIFHEPIKQAKLKTFLIRRKQTPMMSMMPATICVSSMHPNQDAHTEVCNYQVEVHHRTLQQTTSVSSPVCYSWTLFYMPLTVYWMATGLALDEMRNYVHCSCQQSRC